MVGLEKIQGANNAWFVKQNGKYVGGFQEEKHADIFMSAIDSNGFELNSYDANGCFRIKISSFKTFVTFEIVAVDGHGLAFANLDKTDFEKLKQMINQINQPEGETNKLCQEHF